MRGIFAMAIVLASAPALADDSSPGPDQHHKQLEVSLRMAEGIRAIATFDSKLYCGKTDMSAAYGHAPVCTVRTPLALDLELGYGVTRSVDLTLSMKLGLERDFGPAPSVEGPRPFQLAPGARLFFSEANHTKLFIQPELVIDFTGFKNATGGDLGTDLGARGIEGLWIDLHRAYGVYFFVSQTLELARWFQFELDAGVGIQGRYP